MWGTANKNEGNESLVLGNSNYNKSTRGITAGILNYSGDGSGNFVSGYSDTIFDGVSNSINIGQQNVISGTANQAAFGSNNRLEGHSNITWGAYNKILNGSGGLSYSNAIGGQGNILTDSSTYNHVVGRSNYVSRNEYAEVCGYIDTAISATSIFMSGTLNYLNGGSYSAVWGYSNRITGTSSAVFGLSNNVSGKQSAVWGTNNTLSGNNSSVIAGTGLTGAANNTAYADKIVINSGTVGGAAITSDRRLKTNIVANPYGLETVMQLRPVEYDKKAKLASNEYDRHEMGFIAQEIKEIIPQIVDSATNAYNEQILAVDYNSLIPVLTKAIQELKAENDALKEELENTNEASAAKVTSLEAQLALIQVALQAKGIEVSTAEVTVKD
ncbi:MAG: tail fiber domain-containing protein [Bacteroidia bacterium]